MLSTVPCVGGFRTIKDNYEVVAWIDFEGDLNFIGSPPLSKKEEIISFLEENKISFNK